MPKQKTKRELLDAMTKDRLVQLAEKMKVTKAKKSMKKDEIVDLIAKNKKVTIKSIPKNKLPQ